MSTETSARYPGLGGFSYEEVFGTDEKHTSWQCRRACDGSIDVSAYTDADLDSPSFLHSSHSANTDRAEPGIVDTGYCSGPFACGIPACSMYSEDREASQSYRNA